jgi:hypothetical protein
LHPEGKAMRYVFIVMALLCGEVASADWRPPENPDARKILDEARDDTN